MNKVILSVLIVLLAIQGLNAGFLGAIFSVFRAVVGMVFTFAIQIPTVVISFKEVFVMTVPQIVFTSVSNINKGAFNALIKISATGGNASSIAGGFMAMSSKKTKPEKFISEIIAGDVEEVLTEVSITSAALTAISTGCAPPNGKPFTLWGQPFPQVFSCFSNSNPNSTSISCQAKAYVALSMFQVQNILMADEFFQAVSSFCSPPPSSPSGNSTAPSNSTSGNSTAPASNSTAPASNSTAPASNSTAPASNSTAPASNSTAPASNSTAPASNSTAPAANGTSSNSTASGNSTAPADPLSAQELIAMWVSLSASASGFISISGSGPLSVVVGGNFSADLTAALEATTAFMDKFKEESAAFVNCTGNKSFKVKGSKMRKGFKKLFKRLYKKRRRSVLNRGLIGMATFNVGVTEALLGLVSGSSDFLSAVNGLTTVWISSNAKGNGQAFNNLANKLKGSISGFALNLNASLMIVEQSKTALVETGMISIDGLQESILALADGAPECANSSEVVEAVTSFSLEVENCGAIVDTMTEAAFTEATNIFKNALVNVSSLMNQTNDCYKNGCASATTYPFLNYGVKCGDDPSMRRWTLFGFVASQNAININNCLSPITTSMVSMMNSIDAALAAVISKVSAAIANATSTIGACIDAQVNVTLTALEALGEEFLACQSSNSTNSTASNSTANSTAPASNSTAPATNSTAPATNSTAPPA